LLNVYSELSDNFDAALRAAAGDELVFVRAATPPIVLSLAAGGSELGIVVALGNYPTNGQAAHISPALDEPGGAMALLAGGLEPLLAGTRGQYSMLLADAKPVVAFSNGEHIEAAT
jgi:hypothetical protein